MTQEEIDDYIPFEGRLRHMTQERKELILEIIKRQIHKSQNVPQRLYGARMIRDEAI